MNHKKRKGFTLVELIVVITILAVLATIWYISFLWYASLARDSSRIHNISVINRALEYHKLTDPILFQPANMIPITLSWTVVGYQWDMWKTSLGKIGIADGGTDPLDWEYYSYFLSWNKAQILTLLENPKESSLSLINQSTYAAVDYTDRYPYFKGTWLWMILEEDNTPIHRSTDVIAEWEFDIFNPAFSIKKVKSLYTNSSSSVMPALMIGWQLSLNSQIHSSQKCPNNFIAVPGNKDLWQPAFCIWKYEASTLGNDDTLPYQTISWVAPLTSIINSPNILVTDCRGNWDNYHIMTIMEWLTVARNIENVNSNWSNWVVWSGYILGGNNGNATTWFNEGSILNTWPSGNSSEDALRELTLSNWEKIQDFVWNVWEIVKSLNLYIWDGSGDNEIIKTLSPATAYRTALDLFPVTWIASSSTYYSWNTITDLDYKNLYGPKIWTQDNQWIWKFRQTANYVTLVWWDYSDSSSYENWLYSILRTSTNNTPNIWTRCAYSY